MCEKCDAMKRAYDLDTEEGRQKFDTDLQSIKDATADVMPLMLALIAQIMEKHPTGGAVALCDVMAASMGQIIAKAPREIRHLVLMSLIDEITKSINASVPVTEQIGASMSYQRREGGVEQAEAGPTVH